MNTSQAFIEDLRNRVGYFVAEFSITYGEAVGALELLKHELIEQYLDEVLADEDDLDDVFPVDDDEDISEQGLPLE
jgi:hypothetical protein